MRIIEPSFTIQEELDRCSIAVRLEACGRVCYKSEDKITAESAVPFVTRIASHGHNSVLEMAVVSFRIRCQERHLRDLLECQPKYLVIDKSGDGLLVTGSIRAIRELYANYASSRLVNDMTVLLAHQMPFLFTPLVNLDKALPADPEIFIHKLSLAEVDTLPATLCLRHRFVSVKLIVNRAVTHELVRHRPCSFLQESQRYCRYSEDKFDNQVTFIKPMFFREDSPEFLLWRQTMAIAEGNYLKLLKTTSPQAARTVLPNSCKTEIIVFCNLAEWQHIFNLRTSPAAEPSMREIMVPLQEAMRTRFPII